MADHVYLKTDVITVYPGIHLSGAPEDKEGYLTQAAPLIVTTGQQSAGDQAAFSAASLPEAKTPCPTLYAPDDTYASFPQSSALS